MSEQAVPKGPGEEEVFAVLKREAESGSHDALVRLAEILLEGRGCEKDEAAAFAHLIRAAASGRDFASVDKRPLRIRREELLAQLYAEGRGTAVDPVESREHAALAQEFESEWMRIVLIFAGAYIDEG